MAAFAIVASTTPAMAAALFSEDFTDGTIDSGLTSGNIYATGGGNFVNASDHGVGGTGAIYGADGTQGAAGTTGVDLFGWTYSPSSGTAVDLVNKVMFAKISLVSDAFSCSPNNWTPDSYLHFCTDIMGTRGATDITPFSAAALNDSTSAFTHAVTNAGGTTTLQIADGVMVPHNPPSAASVKPLLDGVFTNTFVWRNASVDGKTLTTEIGGALKAEKTTNTLADAAAMTQFTGVRGTLIRTKPTDPAISGYLAYSNVSGQTNSEAPADATKVRVGWSKFDVGMTKSTDFNFDYSIDGSDFNIIKANLGTGGPTDLKTMSLGDANNDGVVDGSDFNALKVDLGTTADTIARKADSISGNKVPNFKYNPATGQMTVSTDAMLTGEGLYSMLIAGPQANSVVPGRTGLNSGSIQWQGDFWRQGYFNGKEQWINLGVLGVNLNTTSDMLIATYAPGLGAGAFGQVEYGATIGGVNSTYYTNVSMVPEPGTLVLLLMAGVAASAAMGVRRRM
jgi:hypothetical protein